MTVNKNVPYYLAAAGLFILLKFLNVLADNNDLLFLIRPVNAIVSLLTDSRSFYTPETGYYHKQLHILINASCSGLNFLALSFLVLTYLTVKYADKVIHKTLCIPASLLLAYLLTVFVNSSRIISSLVVQQQTRHIIHEQQLVHEAIGIIMYLSFLVLVYSLLEKRLKRPRHHA